MSVGGGLGAGARSQRRRRRGRPGLVAVVVVLALIAAGVGWSWAQSGGYYTYEPGDALPVTPSSACTATTPGGNPHLRSGGLCAEVVLPSGRAHVDHGKVLMVDVLVGQTTPWQYALSRLGLLDTFYRAAELHKTDAVLGGAPPSQFGCQGVQEMDQAATDAPVAALRRLGYQVHSTYHGSRVFIVQAGSPAARGGLHCGDVIVAVDGHPTLTSTALIREIEGRTPGSVVTLTVERTVSGGHQVERRLAVTLGKRPGDPKAGFLGIATEALPTYHLPFEVGIDVGDIGGPSDGLALTLGILDSLSGGQLTGGHVVAVTGTIGPGGSVGPVGGVKQKTVAVERAGASVFVVPASEVGIARSEAGRRLRVEGVDSLDQALADLKALGGKIPAA